MLPSWLTFVYICCCSSVAFIKLAGASDPSLQQGLVPEYILKYSPVVRLFEEERFMPYDIREYVKHFRVTDKDGKNITQSIEIQDLAEIQRKYGAIGNGIHDTDRGDNLFLTANEDFSTYPDWLTGRRGRPEIEDGTYKDAPAVLICVDRPDGYVDTFWFYFYSFNLGPFVMGGGPYGNHIGDWEHSLVRFKDGEPVYVWMSAHSGGLAYEYQAMEKYDITRPVLFSARGTHANYATVGQHARNVPYHVLLDFTDRGPLWDPAKNHLAYIYNGTSLIYGNGSVDGREAEYGEWLLFRGHWGDDQLPPEDPRQKFHPFQWRMIEGPLGPLSKRLLDRDVCQEYKWYNFRNRCRVRHKLVMGGGVEAEAGSGQCSRALDSIKPEWLQFLLRLLTSKGFGCFLIDAIWG